MKMLSKSVSSTMLALSLALGSAVMPVKKANAGVIVAAAASTVALPVAIGVVGLFAGFGTSVFSIYWAIDHREKSWYAYGLFMLDQHLENDQINMIIAERYPQLDSYLIEELSNLIRENSSLVAFNENGYKEIILTENQLAPVLEILENENSELAAQIKKDFSRSSL